MTKETNWGPFAYAATLELPEDEAYEGKRVEKLVGEGLLSLCFRAAGSKVQKALSEKGFIPQVEKAGKMVDGPRKDTEYSEESKAVFVAAMNDALAEDGISIRVTGRYEPGESVASRKQAETVYAEAVKKGNLAALMMLCDRAEGESEVDAIHRKFFAKKK